MWNRRDLVQHQTHSLILVSVFDFIKKIYYNYNIKYKEYKYVRY